MGNQSPGSDPSAALAPWRVAILDRLSPIAGIGAAGAIVVLAPEFYRRGDLVTAGLATLLSIAWALAAMLRGRYLVRARVLLWTGAVVILGSVPRVGITGGLGALALALGVLGVVLISWRETAALATMVLAGLVAWAIAVALDAIPRPPISATDAGDPAIALRVLGSIALATVVTASATAYLIGHLSAALTRSEQLVGDLRREIDAREQEERRRAEAERHLWQAQKADILGRIAAGVAHDVNNNLMIISAACELAARDPSASERARTYLATIRDAGDHAAVLNRQLLAVGRRDVAHPERVSLGDVVEKAAAIARPALGKAIELQVDRRDVPGVCVDPAQLQQALLNLMINARDAMPDGGALHVSIEADGEAPSYALTSPGPAASVRVHVRDTGTGIAPDVLPKIFEPFFTTKEVGRGTGLGLAMVCAFAEASGGRVGAISELGAGSTFTIELPAAPAAA